jgi:hypothetical protein
MTTTTPAPLLSAEARQTIEGLVGWLDRDAPQDVSPGELRLIRLSKITEEAGEVAGAIQGVYGANPRKGRTHTWDDVDSEVCDVVITGLVTLVAERPHDAWEFLAARLAHIAARSGVREAAR